MVGNTYKFLRQRNILYSCVIALSKDVFMSLRPKSIKLTVRWIKLEILVSFFVSMVSNLAGHYICRWLDQRLGSQPTA